MVAELGSRAKLLLTCESLFAFHPPFSRATTMFAAASEWICGYGHVMDQIQVDQQVDPIAIAVALLAAARQLAPLGRRVGGATLKRLVGENNPKFEELANQVDWKEPAKTSEENTPDSDISALAPRVLEPELADLKMTPENVQQLRRLEKQGFAKCQIKQYENGQPPIPIDDDHDQLITQHDQLQGQEQQQDDQELFKAIVANRDLGNGAAYPSGNKGEDTTPDGWQQEVSEEEKLKQELRIKNSKIFSLENEMRRMQRQVDELQKLTAQPTLTRRDISTPPVDAIQTYTAGQTDNGKGTCTIMAGILNRRQQFVPDTNSSSDSSSDNDSPNGLYRVASGSNNGGGGDDGDPDGGGDADTASASGNNHSRNGRRSEFMPVKASNIAVTTFTGTNLHINPYLQFYNNMRRLIYSQGEDGELALNLLIEVERQGPKVFTDEQLRDETRQRPKVAQFNRAIMAALLNCTAGIARGMVEYGVENGIDAWRRLYHHYMPLADDMQ